MDELDTKKGIAVFQNINVSGSQNTVGTCGIDHFVVLTQGLYLVDGGFWTTTHPPTPPPNLTPTLNQTLA